MLFNSYTFIIFLFVLLLIYYNFKNWTNRKFILLVASYLFYAAWNPPFVVLLWVSTLIDWTAAKQIYISKTNLQKRTWLMLSLSVNLGLLAFFKYGNFILENLNILTSDYYSFENYSIILPVGISFYTFQTLSYTLDIYRGNTKPSKSFLDYALYVTFFPQLVAGPIVRSDEFLLQCETDKKFKMANFGNGMFWLIVGLFLKIVIADYFLAPVANQVFGTDGNVDMVSSWIGVLAFSGQILCDFSGYSICAIGVALMLGFVLPKNFKFPYASLGFSEFWRRWHISLSSWLRDYLYIPMGGNRISDYRTYQNLMFTMLIGGLWHGASWTFVFWGFLHGLFLTVERLLKNSVSSNSIPVVLRMSFVFILTCITWVFFRANNFSQAWNILDSMFSLNNNSGILSSRDISLVFIITSIILVLSFVFRNIDLELEIRKIKWYKVSFLLAILLYCIITLSGEDQSFIYFQF